MTRAVTLLVSNNDALLAVSRKFGVTPQVFMDIICAHADTYMAGFSERVIIAYAMHYGDVKKEARLDGAHSPFARRVVSDAAYSVLRDYAREYDVPVMYIVDFLLSQFLPTALYSPNIDHLFNNAVAGKASTPNIEKLREQLVEYWKSRTANSVVHRLRQKSVHLSVHPMVLTRFNEFKLHDDVGQTMSNAAYLKCIVDELPWSQVATLLDEAASVAHLYKLRYYSTLRCPLSLYNILCVSSALYHVSKVTLFSSFLVSLIRWYKGVESASHLDFPMPVLEDDGHFNSKLLGRLLDYTISLGLYRDEEEY